MADLPTQSDFKDYSDWPGREVRASDGALGKVEAIYLDEATDAPEWVLVRLDGEDRPTAFVPLLGAEIAPTAISVEHDRERVGGAPHVGEREGDTLTVAEERRLYEHYGLAYSEEESATLLPEDDATQETSETTGEVTDATAAEPANPPDTTGPTGALPDPVHVAAKPRLRRYVDVPKDPSPAAPAAEIAEERGGSLRSWPPLPLAIAGLLALAAGIAAVVLKRRS
jgi:hypothetical protein